MRSRESGQKYGEKNGKTAEPSDVQESDNRIELNGIKSELVICSEAPCAEREKECL